MSMTSVAGLDALTLILLSVGCILFIGWVLSKMKVIASLRQVLYVFVFALLFGMFVASLFPELKFTLLSVAGMAVLGIGWIIQKIFMRHGKGRK
jgi:predicted permease